MQQTGWQRKYFEKKLRFPFEVPQTATETDMWIASDVGGAYSNLLDQSDCLVVPGTCRFNGHWIKHMGPGQPVVFGHLGHLDDLINR